MYCLVVFLRIFCKLKEQFLRVWENFAPPPGIRPLFLPRSRGIRQKKLPGYPRFARSKKISAGLAGGGGERCTQLELTETLAGSVSLLAIENDFHHSDNILQQLISFVCFPKGRIGFSKKIDGLLPRN